MLIIQVDILKKNNNKYLVFNSTDENKEVLKNMQMFGTELKIKSKQYITWEKMITKKIK